MKVDDLAGIWSTNNVGGHSDETLILFADGSGAIDYYNVEFAGRQEFNWSIIDHRAIRICPAVWATEIMDVNQDRIDGRERLKLSFDYPADETLGCPAGRSELEFFRSKRLLSSYVPPTD